MNTRSPLSTLPILAIALAAAATGCMAGDSGDDTAGDDTSGDDTSGDDGGDDGTSVDYTATEFINDFATAECEKAFDCEGEFPTDAEVTFAEAFGANTAECVQWALEFYAPAAIEAAIAGGSVDYDESSAETCAGGLDFGTCAQYFSGQSQLPSACGTAIIGHVADGDACASDFECASLDSWCGEGGACEPIPQ